MTMASDSSKGCLFCVQVEIPIFSDFPSGLDDQNTLGSADFFFSLLRLSRQCYQVTLGVPPQIWLKPFTLSNVHNMKTDGRH